MKTYYKFINENAVAQDNEFIPFFILDLSYQKLPNKYEIIGNELILYINLYTSMSEDRDWFYSKYKPDTLFEAEYRDICNTISEKIKKKFNFDNSYTHLDNNGKIMHGWDDCYYYIIKYTIKLGNYTYTQQEKEELIKKSSSQKVDKGYREPYCYGKLGLLCDTLIKNDDKTSINILLKYGFKLKPYFIREIINGDKDNIDMLKFLMDKKQVTRKQLLYRGKYGSDKLYYDFNKPKILDYLIDNNLIEFGTDKDKWYYTEPFLNALEQVMRQSFENSSIMGVTTRSAKIVEVSDKVLNFIFTHDETLKYLSKKQDFSYKEKLKDKTNLELLFMMMNKSQRKKYEAFCKLQKDFELFFDD